MNTQRNRTLHGQGSQFFSMQNLFFTTQNCVQNNSKQKGELRNVSAATSSDALPHHLSELPFSDSGFPFLAFRPPFLRHDFGPSSLVQGSAFALCQSETHLGISFDLTHITRAHLMTGVAKGLNYALAPSQTAACGLCVLCSVFVIPSANHTLNPPGSVAGRPGPDRAHVRMDIPTRACPSGCARPLHARGPMRAPPQGPREQDGGVRVASLPLPSQGRLHWQWTPGRHHCQPVIRVWVLSGCT